MFPKDVNTFFILHHTEEKELRVVLFFVCRKDMMKTHLHAIL